MSVSSPPRQRDLRRFSRQTGLVVAFLFILTNCAFALFMLHEVRNADEWVSHTQAVMLALQDVRALVREAGSGQRGYVRTGDELFLDTYRRAEQELTSQLARLKTLVSGNPDQSRLVADLTAQIAADRERLAKDIAGATGLAPAPDSQDLVANQRQTDALAASVEPIIALERLILNKRIATAEQRNTETLLLISLGTAISLFVIVAMIYRMLREVRIRRTELAGADAALRDSEQRFRRIFEESPLGIVLAESTGQRIVQANPAFSSLLGYRADELIGRPIAA